MNEEPFLRNHWTYVASNMLRNAFIALIIGIGAANSAQAHPLMPFFIAGLAFAIAAAATLVVWFKTRYYFLENEIVVERTTIFRSETRIQYDRLASVVVSRDFVQRIFGATRLAFNLNSSVNVARAEASIVLEKDQAEELRKTIYARIYGLNEASDSEEPDAEALPLQPDYSSMESLVHVSTWDIFLHSFLGMPTMQFAFGMLMLAYSVLTTFVLETLSLVAILLFLLDFFVPAVSKFFRYYNYRIVRDGDTVVISSGLLSTRTDSFELSKVNFVKVREPLICRLLGMSILEAEVVGTADQNGMPLLCPLKKTRVAMALFESLLPEFRCEAEQVRQPRQSVVGIALWMAAMLAAVIAGTLLALQAISPEHDIYVYVFAAFLTVSIIGWGHLTYRIRTFAMTDSIALFVTGSFDRVSNYILLDKVQFSDVSSSPLQRMFGAGRCSVNLLSTAGITQVQSGVFEKEILENLSYTVRDRIIDGRYDFRRYQ